MSMSVLPVTGSQANVPTEVLERSRPAETFSIGSVQAKAGESAGSANAGQPPAVAQKFEAMVVSFMIKDVIKSDMQSAFGKGAGADQYVSMFADAIAQDIVKAGGFGIAKQIATTRVTHE
ncbi:MAG: rod-binding protein [Nitratireductor sp.]|nr:rod-binding protein [Nitratireductor sp.]